MRYSEHMIGYLLLLFILLPAADLALLLVIGSRIGLYSTLLIIVVTGFTGAILYRTQSWYTVKRTRRALEAGHVPDNEIIDGIFIIAGAALLVTPGLITDLLGFMALLPVTRGWLKRIAKRWLKRQMDNGTITVQRL